MIISRHGIASFSFFSSSILFRSEESSRMYLLLLWLWLLLLLLLLFRLVATWMHLLLESAIVSRCILGGFP